MRWRCHGGAATLAVLDDRFTRATTKWPGLGVVLRERLAEQADDDALRLAIVCLPRADQRILALLWHLAERWGTVRATGVTVDLELTHEFIGRLIGARRPTVSLALQALADRGLVSADRAGGWHLAHGSQGALDAYSSETSAPCSSNGTRVTVAQPSARSRNAATTAPVVS